MSLKSKVAAILFAVMILSLVMQYGLARFIIFPRFIEFEENEAKLNLDRAKRAIEQDIFHLDAFCHDWSAWNDTVDFVKNHNIEYVNSNMTDNVFIDANINLFHFVDINGKTVWRKAMSHETEKEIQLPELPVDNIPQDHPLFPKTSGKTDLAELSVTGIVMIEEKPFAIASRPVLTSENEGPPQGILVMGRFLDPGDLAAQTYVDFSIIPLPLNSEKAEMKGILQKIEIGSEHPVIKKAPDVLFVYALFKDIYGKNAFMVEIQFPRDITRQGMTTIWNALLFSIVGGLLILLFMLLLLHRTILSPIFRLTDHARSIESSGDFSVRLAMKRKDAIGVLAKSFDRMLEEIESQTNKLHRMNRTLEKLSLRDSLTGLSNRRNFDKQLKKEWNRMMREKAELAIIMCDIDHFKLYNDTYGHQAGDNCLRSIGEILTHQLNRPSDMAARYGGEEFVILLPNTSLDGAVRIAGEIREAVMGLNIEHPGSPVDKIITLSLGVAAAVPQGKSVAGPLLEAADRALYKAKMDGRNRVVKSSVSTA